jgi:hypothetical protein
MKTITVTIKFFPGYNLTPPSFSLSYPNPYSSKEINELVAQVENGDITAALEKARSRANTIREIMEWHKIDMELVEDLQGMN